MLRKHIVDHFRKNATVFVEADGVDFDGSQNEDIRLGLITGFIYINKFHG
ncbi:hypothetical protein OB2597_18766 [Pseudooceanicola batsensis HTCC2597]|uniref:Uncharacterized protein n=1 Tax=Pseudooceanicola batsensis (strain ATCC BAA-863 / DSM 15984 / KCTC 12145 / HTCC2597) TaxID=252305 RepID=A3U494_PSEBH|nr:hypothetical protein OB2597_18766 [Pseudooceanicola batsensis HTCC2597]